MKYFKCSSKINIIMLLACYKTSPLKVNIFKSRTNLFLMMLPSLNFWKYLWILWLNSVKPCYGSDQFVSYNKSKPIRFTQSQLYFGKELYMFRTEVFVTLVRLSACEVRTNCCEYSIKTPDDGQ